MQGHAPTHDAPTSSAAPAVLWPACLHLSHHQGWDAWPCLHGPRTQSGRPGDSPWGASKCHAHTLCATVQTTPVEALKMQAILWCICDMLGNARVEFGWSLAQAPDLKVGAANSTFSRRLPHKGPQLPHPAYRICSLHSYGPMSSSTCSAWLV
jgi:hypothetical protein